MRALGRLLPDGLAGRFALVLAAALIAANLAALSLFAVQRASLDRAALIDRELERIVSLVPLIEAAPPEQQALMARRASTRMSRLSVDPAPAVRGDAGAGRTDALLRDLATALPGRELRAAVSRHGAAHRGARVSIAIALQSGGRPNGVWLNATSRGEAPPRPAFDVRVSLLVLALSLLFVLGVGLVFVRRLTRPLADLARAARAAGRGDRSARVAERGARELREAAAAFNDMQAQIARFDAERMRTMAALGHDLRTPITSLRIRAELLDEAEAAPMIRTLEEMTVMAEGLVAFARGAGEPEDARPVDLAPLLRRLCEDRGAALTVERPAQVIARPVALGRALGNLVDNAIRYGGEAQVTLTRGASEARILIADRGPGIAPERLGSVFEPFVRGEDSRSMDTGGTGLGLSIARAIVTSHGGTITLANREGGGLLATVGLPLAADG